MSRVSRLPPVHRDGLTMAKLCATPGLCLFCEAKLNKQRDYHPRTTTRRQLTCGAADCTRAYNSAWRRDWLLAREWMAWKRRRAA